MANFFNSFPVITYAFGNNPDRILFQNITAYIKIIESLKDNTVFYETQFINDFERPDTMSFKLYGTTDFYWTFYYMNDDVRESGWPLAELEIQDKLKSDYPHRTITTQDPIASTVLVGDTVVGQSSGSIGTVVKKYIDLGQIIVKSPDNFGVGELVVPEDRIADTITVNSEVEQYNSVHHYENSSKEYVDIDPFNPSLGGLTPVTYSDRVYAKNDSLRELKVLKPSAVTQVQAEYNRLLKE